MRKAILGVAVCATLALGMFGCSQAPDSQEQGTATTPNNEQSAPAPEKTPEELKAELSSLIENQPTNLTAVMTIDTKVSAAGESMDTTMKMTVMADMADGYKGYVKMEAPDTQIDGLETFVDGETVIGRLGDQVFDASDEADMGEDPVAESNAQALAVVKAAKDIKMTESGGKKTFEVTIDGGSAASLGIDQLESLSDVVATYTFDADGHMTVMDMTVEGNSEIQGQEVSMEMAYHTVYSDFNTTQVPAAPEV